jgi:hypothetical protein
MTGKTGKRDEEALSELTDEEREAIAEADTEETEKEAATEAEIAEAVQKATPERDESTGRFKAKEDGEDADGGDKDAEPAKPLVDEDEREDPDAAAAKADADAPDTDAADADVGKGEDAATDTSEVDDLPPARALAKAPEDAEAKLADIDKREDDLADKFDNGDLTTREYNAELRKLSEERFDIKMAVQRASDADENRKSTWLEVTVPEFFRDNKEFTAQSSKALYAALDAEVRDLQQKASEAGKDPFAPAILTKAAVKVRKAFSAFGSGDDDEPAPRDKPKSTDPKALAAKAVKDAGKRPASPQTLAGLPAADPEDVGTGDFAQLDRLMETNPEAFEDAMARMPAAERERYLASAH